jgi:F-type H+-transporting ATPase subunit delta
MIKKSRGEVLFETANEYINQYNFINHIIRATVVTPSVLSDSNKQTMTDDIKAATGCKVILDSKIDPSLIGGFVLTVGDRQIDTSIASDLKRLRKEFAQRAIAK